MAEPAAGTEQQGADAAQELAKSLVAAINQAPEKEHGRILKAYLLSGLERRFHYENMYWDWMRDVACAAVDNMQDARIAILEGQVRALREKKGEEFSVGGFIIDLAFMIAFEAAIAALLPAAAGAAASLAMMGLASRAVAKRQRLRDALSTARASAYRSTVLIEDLQKRWFFIRWWYLPSETRRRTEAMKVIYRSFGDLDRSFVDDLVMRRSKFLAKLDEVHPELGEDEVKRGMEAKLKERLGTFLEVASERIRENAATAATKGTVDALAEAMEAGEPAAPAPPSDADAFKSGHFLLPVLDYVYGCKEGNLREYCELKAALLVEDEDHLLERKLASDLYGDLLTELPTLEGAMLPNLAACAPDMVDGMEFTLWLYQFADSLQSREVKIRAPTGSFDPYGDAEFFVHSAVPDSDAVSDRMSWTTVTGRIYPAMTRMSPELADYLFRKYARAYYRKGAGLPDGIGAYREDAYLGALQLPERNFWGFRSEERAQLLAEMKVLVVEYLVVAAAELKMKKTGGVFGDPEALAEMFPPLQPIDDLVARKLEQWEEERAKWLKIQESERQDRREEEFEAAMGELFGHVFQYRSASLEYSELARSMDADSDQPPDLGDSTRMAELGDQLEHLGTMIIGSVDVLELDFKDLLELPEHRADLFMVEDAKVLAADIHERRLDRAWRK